MEKSMAFIAFFFFSSFCMFAVSYSVHVPAIFIFGDSVFDAGNMVLTKTVLLRLISLLMVQAFFIILLGDSLMEELLQTSYDIIPIKDQPQQFQQLVNQNKIDKNLLQKSLFFFESVSNDIYNYFMSFDPPTLSPDAYVQAMLTEVANLINQLYILGARRFAVFSLGPVGCVPARVLLPDAPSDQCFGKMNVMVENYNKGLESLVQEIPINKYPGAVAVYGGVYDLVQRFRATPTRYGFTDVSDAGDGTLGGFSQCGREGYKICENPNSFLFWDYFRPSEHTYKLIAKALWGGKISVIRPLNLKTLSNIPPTQV